MSVQKNYFLLARYGSCFQATIWFDYGVVFECLKVLNAEITESDVSKICPSKLIDRANGSHG